MIDFKCEFCGADVEAPESLAGQAEACPTCGALQTIPLLQELTPRAQAPTTKDPSNVHGLPYATTSRADQQAVTESPTSAPEATWCLDCGRKINSGATRCPNCGWPVPLMTYEDHPLAHQVLSEWLAIDPTTKLRCFGCERKLSLAGLPTPTMKCPFCGFIPSPGICQAWLNVLERRRQREIVSQPRLRAVKRTEAWNGPKRQGQCSRCGKESRSLTETEDKQWACRTCYWELYPALATERQIHNLRRAGITVPDDLIGKEGRRLWVVHSLRKLGLSLPDDTPLAELLPANPIHDLNVILGSEHGGPISVGFDAPVHHFYTKVAGVAFKNDDGSDRQEILSKCFPLQTLRVEHEDNNPHDRNAIRISTDDGRQIGYLFKHEASNVWLRMKRNFTHAAVSANITGGTKNKPHLGMTILFLVGRPGVSQEEMQAYLARIMPAIAADVYDYDPDDYDADDDDDGEGDSDGDSNRR